MATQPTVIIDIVVKVTEKAIHPSSGEVKVDVAKVGQQRCKSNPVDPRLERRQVLEI